MILRDEKGLFIKGSKSRGQSGKLLSKEHKRKIAKALTGNTQSILGAAARWKDHVRVYPKQVTPKVKGSWSKSFDPEVQQQKKRFRNQRYKASKRKAEGTHTFEEWVQLKNKYFNMCLCCKAFEPFIKLTEDHIVPLSLGGSDYIENIQPLCQICNTRKHAKFISYLPIDTLKYLN